MSSTSSSRSGSASPSPEPELEIPLAKKSKSKAAQSAKTHTPAQGRNEGIDLDWAYTPPANTHRLDDSADLGEFDWDALNGNDDLELWLVRIPDGVKPKYLETAQLELSGPSKRDSRKSAKMGMLQRKHVAYDIWSVGDDVPEELPIGGEEVKGLSCLLPRKSKKGKLYNAPAIARTLVMSAQSVKPTPDPARAVYKNPPREVHPKELLTHKFVPYGAAGEVADANANAARATTPMEVDAGSKVLVPVTPAAKSKGDKAEKKSKGKKRKGEEGGAVAGESPPPKKPKKAKTAS
ncbi:hypothetical protein B0H16DRAFT_1524299 [Mycena metata]|uniref:Uncharacterized protein n=1 Tax=Mycena metata TaxID=1033252 RepID=A0AAD7JLD9_9AGAR|nr:hypothetical protein B0H16DRAFT_1524299 [Mycena metata]